MAFSIKIQLFADNDGVIGGAIDSVVAGNRFYAQILVGDFRNNAVGLIGFLSSIKWDSSILESLDDPFNPDEVVAANFPAVFGGTLDNTLGQISDLAAGALPAFDLGQAIGVDKLEPFATLHFLAKADVTASDFVLTPNLSSLAFTDGYVNNAPLIPTPEAFLENSNDIILTVSDPNPEDTVTFAITGGADQSLFTLDLTTGQLRFNSIPDFENPIDTNQDNIYEVQITAYDNFGEPATTTLRGLTVSTLNIQVANVNETPTDLILSNTSINENVAPLTVIGNFSTTDVDAGNTFSYSLVNGAGDTDNNVFSISSNQLRINQSPDFESKNSYSIRVKTTDQGGLGYEEQLTINVNDLNEINGNPSINNGRNSIIGTTAADYITGGPGAKTITGGLGNDFFVFTDLRDVGQRITDFKVGEDKIVLTKLLSSISYNGTNPIAAQYIRFVAGIGINANSTFLQIDRDGISGSAIFKNFLQVDNITTTQLNNVNNFVF